MAAQSEEALPPATNDDVFDDEDDEETAADEDDDDEEEASEDQETGDDESSSCLEEEEAYKDQPAAGLSPRKVLKRAMVTLKEDEDAHGRPRIQRVDTFADFEKSVDAGKDPVPVGLHRVDTFGQSISASAEAAARARLARGTGPPVCPAIARLAAQTSSSSSSSMSSTEPVPMVSSSSSSTMSSTEPVSMVRAGSLRALPEVADALRAVDGDGDDSEPAEARPSPVTRCDTMEFLQHPSAANGVE